MSLKRTIKRSMSRPTRPSAPTSRVVYGAGCVWWDTIDKAATLPGGLPCCPHCGCVLYEIEEAQWRRNVDEHERRGNPGYRALIEQLRGHCFPSYEQAKAALSAKADGGGK